jgi:hypothetical protein
MRADDPHSMFSIWQWYDHTAVYARW